MNLLRRLPSGFIAQTMLVEYLRQ